MLGRERDLLIDVEFVGCKHQREAVKVPCSLKAFLVIGLTGVFYWPISLKYLDYADFVPDAYAAVNFESLVEARLDLQVVVNHQLNVVAVPWEGAAISSDPTNLFQGIRNVKILDLASPSTFESVVHLPEQRPTIRGEVIKMIQDIKEEN
ncbi:unnamed protein product, partial [Thlaspi arvense]